METDVYFLCPQCNGITNAKGNGDITDLITCNKCGNKFKSRLIGNLSIELDRNDIRWLYLIEDIANILIK
jgi:tRNA(Ile2) C34 agmatinyltransferase TiaS